MTGLEQVASVCSRISLFACQQGCSDCCQSKPILVGIGEYNRILQETGKRIAWSETGCSLLVDGKCSIYPIRPTLCRLFGIVRDMQCPKGKVSGELLTHAEAEAQFLESIQDGFYDLGE